MRCERLADVTLRYMPVRLVPSHYHADKAPIDIWVVHAAEENPPLGAQALEWFLLTTMEPTSGQDAQQCLRWYCLRWRIEDWHRVLKSGCRIESITHKSAQRLRRAIAINLVIAWRLMLMTLLGREVPELPAETVFSDIELRTLRAYAKKTIDTADTTGRCAQAGSEDWRLHRAQRRPTPGPSADVAGLQSPAVHVHGIRAAK